MLSLPLSEDRVKPLLEPYKALSLAAVNGPSLCVVSGPDGDVEAFAKELKASGYESRILHTSHAFHSAMMEPVLEAFGREALKVEFHEPRIPYLSNVTGDWITVEDARAPGYWVSHIRAGVKFSAGVARLLEFEDSIFVEVGPGRVLSTFVKQQAAGRPRFLITDTLRHPKEEVPDSVYFLRSLGRLWLWGEARGDAHGAWITEHGVKSEELRAKHSWVSLPLYPFDPTVYPVPEGGLDFGGGVVRGEGVEESASGVVEREVSDDFVGPRDEVEERVAAVWEEHLGFGPVGVDENFFDLSGNSLLATQIVSHLREVYPVELPLQRFLETPTIAFVSEEIRRLLAEKIESMSEEDLNKLL